MKKPLYSLTLITTMLSASLLATQVAAHGYEIPANTPPHIRRGVESPDRTDDQLARDAGRKPAEVLTLADINEGDHVAEITTFGLYYTPMLLGAVGATGKVEMYDLPGLAVFQDGAVGEAGQAFAGARPNAEYHIVDYNVTTMPAGLDAVYNVLFYHDFAGMNVDAAPLNSKVFAALRPGDKYRLLITRLRVVPAGARPVPYIVYTNWVIL